jgi:hypothetical protein
MSARLRTRVRSARSERGAVSVLVAFLVTVLFACAALGVDIASQVNERQALHDTIDYAAHAGAFELPSGNAAGAATTMATRNDAASTPAVDLFCVVGSKLVSGSYVVDEAHIPTSCNPGPPHYTAGNYPGLRCNATICAIPCFTAQGDQCNTVRVTDEKTVPFRFAPVIGINQGSTGSISSSACKGACGSLAPNPIDFAVVGDRTGSMSGAEVQLEDAIESLLEYLTPSQHHVALGTIGRSAPAGSGSGNTAPSNCLSKPSSSKSTGPWFPVGLSNDYDLSDVTPPSSPVSLNTSGGSPSRLAQAADCIGNNNSSTGTYLASPMRAARELLTGTCASSLCTPGLALRSGVKKGIIFMTDGEPNEDTDPDGSSGTYPYSSNGATACTNAKNEATTAKNNGILVVTIAFRLDNVRCDGSGTAFVTATLAAMASPRSNGSPSADDGGGAGPGCNTTAEIDGENADGDFFFCTPTAAQLEPIFRTAASQIAGGIRLVRLP